MREIKFRGKDIETNQWVYGDLLQCPEKYPTIRMWKEAYPIAGSVDFVVIPETVGQFTGLKDKHGKEIYEGDILHVKLYRNAFMNETKEFRDAFDVDDLKGELMEEFTSPVEFTECSFGIRDFYLDSFWKDPKHCYPIHDIKVIGNIHNNPELLKGGEE